MDQAFSKAWSGSLRTFFRHYLLLLGAFIMTVVAAVVCCMTVVGLILLPAFCAGIGVIYLKLLRGQRVQFWKDFTSQISNWWTLFSAMFVKYFFISIGLCLLIVPGLYLMTRWAFVFPLIFDQGCSFKEAFKKSSSMVKGKSWGVFGFIILVHILATVIGSIGTINLLLGAYPELVYFSFYDYFKNNVPEDIEVEVVVN